MTFLGARFANYQTKLGIIKIIENYVVEVAEETKIPYEIDPKKILLSPIGGMHLKFKKYANVL